MNIRLQKLAVEPRSPEEKEALEIRKEEDYYRALSRISRHHNKERMLRELLRHLADTDRNQLAAEKRKADVLLHNILPSYMIKELKAHGKVTPAHHENAFILFTDFVGFSRLSRYMSPRELLRELTIYFDAFEQILERYGLEKVKTIGDSLLCVGGVRGASRHTARTVHLDTILAAMEMMRFTYRRQMQREGKGETAWGMRVAVHSGPLVAGVVGHSKIAFDIWGHAVNVASRIETVAPEGQITVSEAVYQKVRDFFDCRFVGEQRLKGVGLQNIYQVDGLRKVFREVEDYFLSGDDESMCNRRFRLIYEYLKLGHHVMRKDGRYHVIKKKGAPLPEGVSPRIGSG